MFEIGIVVVVLTIMAIVVGCDTSRIITMVIATVAMVLILVMLVFVVVMVTVVLARDCGPEGDDDPDRVLYIT